MEKHIEITCDDAENCDESVFIMAGNDLEPVDWITDHDQNDQVHKSIVLSCSDAEEGSDCSQKHVWVSAGKELDFEELHKQHANGYDHKVIIKKELRTED